MAYSHVIPYSNFLKSKHECFLNLKHLKLVNSKAKLISRASRQTDKSRKIYQCSNANYFQLPYCRSHEQLWTIGYKIQHCKCNRNHSQEKKRWKIQMWDLVRKQQYFSHTWSWCCSNWHPIVNDFQKSEPIKSSL